MLLSTLYKVYTMVLTERLREEEREGIIPQNKTGFRKGMGTVYNIYVLNYIANRQLERTGGKLTVMFMDLKAAFDSMDRGMLLREMKGRRIRKGIVERVKEVMRETKSRVRMEGETGEAFWTARGVRQGCPLSPLLFNVLLADGGGDGEG